LFILPKDFADPNESNDLFFISKGYCNTDFLVFFDDGTGKLYAWGGSFRSKFDFEWSRRDSLYIINFKENTHQSESLIHEKGGTLELNESDLNPYEKTRVLSNNQRFKRVSTNKFLRRYKEFLEQGF
jgi:hypothetical protein